MKFLISTFLLLPCLAYAMQAEVTAKANQATALRGYTAYLSGDHSVKFTNDTDAAQTIRIRYWLCPEANECVKKRFKVTIAPHQTYTDFFQSHASVVFNRAGYKSLTATTLVDGAVNAGQEDTTTITVN